MSNGEHQPKRLAIIDGKSVFYRGYYAMPNLSTKDGTPTGGVYGFAAMALEVLKRLKPDYVCVAWDKPKTNIRKRVEMYPEYKAGRKPAPPDFYEQIPLLHELLDAFGWPLYELDDYEADDIMGTLALQATEQGIETMLVTSDLDMLQLVHPMVHVYALKKGLSNIELFRPESFILKYGITPEQFLDLKALMGDSSDNIPGVAGIGKKGATDLLKEHKSLDGVYDNLDLIRDTVRKKLEAGKESAYLSKKIAAIWTDAPLTIDLESMDVANCDPHAVRDSLQKFEFRSLVRQLPEAMRVVPGATEDLPASDDDLSISAANTLVDSDDKLQALTAQLKQADQIVLYSRAAGKHGKRPQVLMISPSTDSVYTLLLNKLSKKLLSEKLGPILKNETLQIAGHDLKNSIQVCYELGIELENAHHDTQIGAFLLNPLRRDFALTDLASADLGYEGSSLEDCDADELASRAPDITAIIYSLMARQLESFKNYPKLAELARSVEWPVIPVLAAMEYEGIQLDTDYLNDMNEDLSERISDIQQQIYGYADQEFNIGSPSQLAEILFEKLDLPKQGIKRGKTGFSTAASELEKLRGTHPIIDLISHYREYTKLQNTYVEALPKLVDENSRLHTTFNLTIAQTGRLSSTDPNLQNIPVRTELGRRIRTAFVAGEGNVLVSADYSQFELRLAAYLASDQELIEMFNRDTDIHTATAAQVYGREPEDVTKNMRRDAKVINFGILYGMSPHGLSIATGMTREAAQQFIDKYFELRKPLLEYMNKLKDQARKDGYVETLFGRRRPTPDIHSSNFVVRQAAERAAINMPIQGTEADLMKMAMVKIQENLKSLVSSPQSSGQKTKDQRPKTNMPRMLLQIHDSILVECPEEQGERVAKLLKTTMEGIHELPVKLTVDTSIGKNWGEL
jgi:DNA polymerase I